MPRRRIPAVFERSQRGRRESPSPLWGGWPAGREGFQRDEEYRMALVVDGACVMRFDNEAGKGDHKHVDGRETAYVFRGVDALFADFAAEVKGWFDGNARSDD